MQISLNKLHLLLAQQKEQASDVPEEKDCKAKQYQCTDCMLCTACKVQYNVTNKHCIYYPCIICGT
jgi:hypothetical protein